MYPELSYFIVSNKKISSNGQCDKYLCPIMMCNKTLLVAQKLCFRFWLCLCFHEIILIFHSHVSCLSCDAPCLSCDYRCVGLEAPMCVCLSKRSHCTFMSHTDRSAGSSRTHLLSFGPFQFMCHVLIGFFVSCVMFSLVYCLILYSVPSFHWFLFDQFHLSLVVFVTCLPMSMYILCKPSYFHCLVQI